MVKAESLTVKNIGVSVPLCMRLQVRYLLWNRYEAANDSYALLKKILQSFFVVKIV